MIQLQTLMELVIHLDSIINSNEMSHLFRCNFKLQSDLRIVSYKIDNADLWHGNPVNQVNNVIIVFCNVK